jgi:hypothetical protein
VAGPETEGTPHGNEPIERASRSPIRRLGGAQNATALDAMRATDFATGRFIPANFDSRWSVEIRCLYVASDFATEFIQ